MRCTPRQYFLHQPDLLLIPPQRCLCVPSHRCTHYPPAGNCNTMSSTPVVARGWPTTPPGLAGAACGAADCMGYRYVPAGMTVGMLQHGACTHAHGKALMGALPLRGSLCTHSSQAGETPLLMARSGSTYPLASDAVGALAWQASHLLARDTAHSTHADARGTSVYTPVTVQHYRITASSHRIVAR